MSKELEYGMFCPTHGWRGYIAKFCRECGAALQERLAPLCPNCGEPAQFTYCTRCGHRAVPEEKKAPA